MIMTFIAQMDWKHTHTHTLTHTVRQTDTFQLTVNRNMGHQITRSGSKESCKILLKIKSILMDCLQARYDGHQPHVILLTMLPSVKFDQSPVQSVTHSYSVTAIALSSDTTKSLLLSMFWMTHIHCLLL